MDKDNKSKKGTINLPFYFYLCKLRLQNLSMSLYRRFIPPHLFAIFSIFYFLLVLVISNTITLFLSERFLINDSVAFFTSVGAMLGGILAIVFSLSTFLIQNAAQHMSSGFYDTVAKDKLQDFIFWIIAIFTFIFFFLAVVFTSSYTLNKNLLDIIAYFSILAIGLVLWLLFVSFKRIYARIRPMNALLIIKKDVIQYLNRLKKVAKKMSPLIQKHPELSNKISNEMALAVSFQNLKPHFDFINSRLDYLFDYHDKLLSHQEKRMARIVLTTSCHILRHYFGLRSDSSVILPSSEFFMVGVSDSQGFLTPSLEHLVSVGNNYMRNSDDVGISHVISIFEDLTISARNIKYTSNVQKENPIFAQCRAYLDQLMEAAIMHTNMEALYQGAKAYSQIGTVAIENRMQYELSATYGVLNRIAYCALLKGYDVVWGQVIDTYVILSQKFVLKWPSFSFEINLKSLFEHLRYIILQIYHSFKSGIIRNALIMSMKVDVPFQQIERFIFGIKNKINEIEDEKEINNWKNKFLILVEELRSTLRYLSEQMKNADDSLINTFGNVIANIGCLLLELSQDKKWSEEGQELQDKAGWYLHQTWWFINNANAKEIKCNMSFDSLIEAITKIGIQSLQIEEDKITKESLGLLSEIANRMLNEGKSPIIVIRIIERACYLGILALKFNKKDLVKELKDKIAAFQKAYEEKYPQMNKSSLPRRDQLEIEIINLRRDVEKMRYNHTKTVLDSSKDRLAEKIDTLDVDKFTFEIWKFFVSGSPLEKELNIEKKIKGSNSTNS